MLSERPVPAVSFLCYSRKMREGDRGTKWISVEIKLVEDEVKREIMLCCTTAVTIQLPNNISEHKHPHTLTI
jgi:hypothetical protein